ncbi:hypothetical protein [Enterococcus sp. LJL90]
MKRKLFFGILCIIGISIFFKGDYVIATSTNIPVHWDMGNNILRQYENILTDDDKSNLNNFGFIPLKILTDSSVDQFSYNSQKEGNIFGIQYINTTDLTINGQVQDFRYLTQSTAGGVPGMLSEYENTLKIRNISINNIGSDSTASIGHRDLNFLTDMINLENVSLTFGNSRSEISIPLTDISALDKLPNLKTVNIYTKGDLAPIYLREGTTSYDLPFPLRLSSHFNIEDFSFTGQGLSVDRNSGYSMEQPLTLKNISSGQEYINLSFSNHNLENSRFNYSAELYIPIIWV